MNMTVHNLKTKTDPLDGLNKPLTEDQMSVYLKQFNALLLQEGQTPLNEDRPYIIQVARFDPSKGIPDFLEAYKKLRNMLEEQQMPIPQLVITGNRSIDDPDGVPIMGANLGHFPFTKIGILCCLCYDGR
jgi:alpha,alpha-trehalose phosphorylase (configuration-retaining)